MFRSTVLICLLTSFSMSTAQARTLQDIMVGWTDAVSCENAGLRASGVSPDFFCRVEDNGWKLVEWIDNIVEQVIFFKLRHDGGQELVFGAGKSGSSGDPHLTSVINPRTFAYVTLGMGPRAGLSFDEVDAILIEGKISDNAAKTLAQLGYEGVRAARGTGTTSAMTKEAANAPARPARPIEVALELVVPTLVTSQSVVLDRAGLILSGGAVESALERCGAPEDPGHQLRFRGVNKAALATVASANLSDFARPLKDGDLTVRGKELGDDLISCGAARDTFYDALDRSLLENRAELTSGAFGIECLNNTNSSRYCGCMARHASLVADEIAGRRYNNDLLDNLALLGSGVAVAIQYECTAGDQASDP